MMIKLRNAGCKRIHYGIEASNPEVLKSMCKEITLEQAEEAIALTKDFGIETLAYFIIGSPTETPLDIVQTIRYAKQLKPDYCHFAIMTPYPATPLYQLGLNRKLYEDYWLEFAKNPKESFQPPYWPEINRVLLENLLDKAYKDFYLTPKFIVKQALKTHSVKEILHKAKVATKMLRG
jgi:radical SAM superfamily enzyme YgiQ (UPF0313 family)